MHFIKLFSDEKDVSVVEEKDRIIKGETRCGIGGMVAKDT